MINSRMLVTTCPDCDTTFKLTVAILEKAGGQVRCGRCARIFDANTRLREQPETATEQLPAAARARAEVPTDDELAFAEAITSATGSRWFLHDDPPDAATDLAAATETAAATGAVAEDRDAETGGSESAASAAVALDTEFETEAGADFESEAEADAGESSEPQTTRLELALSKIADSEITEIGEPIDAVADPAVAAPLTAIRQATAAVADAATDWREAGSEPVRRRTWPWAIGAGFLTLTLAAQLIHAARSEIAALPGVGPTLILVYAAFGREVSPPVALEQYSSLNLTAVAEPVSDEHGWLIIETRVRNDGPKVQPYPHILVRILDRWGATIAGRYFAPAEYLVTPQADYSRMNVGSTVGAQFIIVDPGPSATGFELEFCARVEDTFVCDTQ